jgi:hypothetical protein
MFLSASCKTLSVMLAAAALATPGRARADAKQCVQQNNDGAELRDHHHVLAARDAYRACVAESECPAMVRSECDAALIDLKTAIPTLLVSVVDEQGHDLPSASLVVDDRPVAIDGSVLEVDPGAHELRASQGELSSQLQLMAIENDANRRVELVLRAAKQAALLVTADKPPLQSRRSKVPTYVLGGVAALGAAGFGYFALVGHQGLGHLNECKPYCAASEVKRVRSEYLAADISLGFSVVALAVAGYWLLSAPGEARVPEQKPLSLSLNAGPGAAGLSVRWAE